MSKDNSESCKHQFLSLNMLRFKDAIIHEVIVGECWDKNDWFLQENVGAKRSFTKAKTFGDILSHLDICSKSQARKNNWNFPLQRGYSEYVYGKKPPILIYIWYPEISNNCFTIGFGLTPIWDRWND